MFEKKLKKLFWAFAEGRVKKGTVSQRLGPSPSILFLRPDHLGDFLLSAPAIRAIEEKIGPSGRMTIVAGVRNAAVARSLFPKAEVLVFDPFLPSRLLLFLKLWTGRYDATVDFHSYPFSTTSALMSLLSGGPIRVGFWAGGDFEEYRESSKKVYNQGIETPPENTHESRKSLQLARKLYPGISPKVVPPVPNVPQETIQAAKDFYQSVGASGKTKLLGLHPTLGKVDNRWSQERYVELVRKMQTIPGLKIVVVHGWGEEYELKRFQELLRPLSNVFVLPRNDIFFILEAAKHLDLFICNDSGLMHLVSGVTRLLAVFGPSDPRRWGPLSAKGYRPKIFRKKDRICDSVRASEVAQEAFRALKR